MTKIIIILFTLLVLTSCFGDSQEVIDAKKDLGIIEKNVEDVQEENDNVNNNINNNVNNNVNNVHNTDNNIGDLSEDPRISIKQISGEKILELDKLKYSDFKNGHSKITGKTLGDVDSIQIDFSNENSQYPNDSFVLKKFKSGGEDFAYNANSKFKVLDFGLNKYLFIATTGDKKSILELKVLVSVNDDEYLDGKSKKQEVVEKEEETKTTELIGDENNIVLTELPKGGDFGNVIKLGEKSFTYSDIKGLEIKKEILPKINCGKNEDTDKYFVTEFLGEKLNSYYYWNTCRDLIKDKGFGFYVVRLEGDKYFYEKHYIDLVHGFYGLYELETGTGVDKDNISDKNKELKEKNRDFKNIEIVDNLFKKIIK